MKKDDCSVCTTYNDNNKLHGQLLNKFCPNCGKELSLLDVEESKNILIHLKKKVEFFEKSLLELRGEIQKLEVRSSDNHTIKGIPVSVNIERLLSDERYRLEVALQITKTNRKAASLLKMSERTLYRQRLKFNMDA
jgi:hypothetical protein